MDECEAEYQELLQALGWLPQDLSCPEKKRLADEYLEASKSWRNLGRDFNRNGLERLRQNYAGARLGLLDEYRAKAPVLEEARLKAARARLALEAHIAEHRC